MKNLKRTLQYSKLHYGKQCIKYIHHMWRGSKKNYFIQVKILNKIDYIKIKKYSLLD